MSAVDKLILATLGDGDWSTLAALDLKAMMDEVENGVMTMPDLPAVGKLPDPMEEFCRAHDAASVSVQYELLMPALWAHACAVTGGGVWVAWEGREGAVQAVPLAFQHLGLAQTGAGKSTTLDLCALPYKLGMRTSAADAKGRVLQTVAAQRKAAMDSLADWKAKVASSPGDIDGAAAYAAVESAVLKAIDNIGMRVSADLSGAGSGEIGDATVEAALGAAYGLGGAVMIRSAEQDFLDNIARYSKKGQTSSLSLLTHGWDGAGYARMRVGVREEIAALVVSVSLMTQNDSFTNLFSGEGGQGLLSKGVLGRMLMTLGRPVSVDVLVEEEIARSGKSAAGSVEWKPLAIRFASLAGLGAEYRGLRLVEGKIRSEAIRLVERRAGSWGEEAVEQFNLALDSAEFACSGAVSLDGLKAGGVGGGGVGTVVWLPAAVAEKLEALFALCKALLVGSSAEEMLAPVLSRWVSHLVRVAVVRWLVAGSAGVGGLEDYVSDTATRLMPWLLRQHVRALAEVVSVARQEEARQEAFEERGVVDGSLLGLLVDKMLRAMGPDGLVQGIDGLGLWSVSRLARWGSSRVGGIGGTVARERALKTALWSADADRYFIREKVSGGRAVRAGDGFMDRLKGSSVGKEWSASGSASAV